jgi:hypothetical protein
MQTFCPASMCPLTAPDGSPWTGDENAVCPQRAPLEDEAMEALLRAKGQGGCGFWQAFGASGCGGCESAHHQVGEAARDEGVLVIGPRQPRRTAADSRKRVHAYPCDRAHECQWQIEADREGGLCPPRSALRLGLDPRVCNW